VDEWWQALLAVGSAVQTRKAQKKAEKEAKKQRERAMARAYRFTSSATRAKRKFGRKKTYGRFR
jgi:hypothetical protein